MLPSGWLYKRSWPGSGGGGSSLPSLKLKIKHLEVTVIIVSEQTDRKSEQTYASSFTRVNGKNTVLQGSGWRVRLDPRHLFLLGAGPRTS